MLKFESVSFHEAEVLELSKVGGSIRLKLDLSVYFNPEFKNKNTVLVLFDGVSEIFIQDISSNESTDQGHLVDEVGLEVESPAVLSLEAKDGAFELMLEWRNYEEKKDVIKLYRIICGSVRCEESVKG